MTTWLYLSYTWNNREFLPYTTAAVYSCKEGRLVVDLRSILISHCGFIRIVSENILCRIGDNLQKWESGRKMKAAWMSRLITLIHRPLSSLSDITLSHSHLNAEPWNIDSDVSLTNFKYYEFDKTTTSSCTLYTRVVISILSLYPVKWIKNPIFLFMSERKERKTQYEIEDKTIPPLCEGWWF